MKPLYEKLKIPHNTTHPNQSQKECKSNDYSQIKTHLSQSLLQSRRIRVEMRNERKTDKHIIKLSLKNKLLN